MTKLDQILNKINGGYVLDVADASGYFMNYINKFLEFKRVTIVDIKIDDKILKRHNPKIECLEADAVHLPYQNESFDTVCISNSLHHLPFIDQTLNEMCRVLKINGIFIINEMFCDGQNELQKSHVMMHHWKEKITGLLDGVNSQESFAHEKIINIATSLQIQDWNTLEYNFEVVPDSQPIYEYTGGNLNELLDEIDTWIARIQEQTKYKFLIEEGKQLKQRIISIGFAPCSSLIMIGKKLVEK